MTRIIESLAMIFINHNYIIIIAVIAVIAVIIVIIII